MTADDIIDFWFSDSMRPAWFRSTVALDTTIRTRFEATWRQATLGRFNHWDETAAGALALVILLDQFPLNMFRGTARAFASEGDAIRVARQAVERGFDATLSDPQKAFLYMPLMHSESLVDQERSVELYEAAGLVDNLRFARHHRELVQRFGRFPHRNAILGRESTAGERAYLASKEAFTG